MITAIVDIGTAVLDGKRQKAYRLVFARKLEDGKWEYSKVEKIEGDLINDIVCGKLKIANAELVKVKGSNIFKLKGRTGEFSRFNNKVNKPLVILEEIIDENGVIIGYKVANCYGEVATMRISKLLHYCEEVSAKGGIPIQNGMYVAAMSNQKAHIRSYPNGEYAKEVFKTHKNAYSVKPEVNTKKNSEALKKLEEIFSKEQIEQLKLGKKQGMNIKKIANPKLSAQQMKELRGIESCGHDCKVFADPRYSVEALMLIKAEAKYHGDLSCMMNPEYSAEQLAILSIANDDGIDIKKLGGPKVNVEEMQERLVRLQMETWKQLDVRSMGKEKNARFSDDRSASFSKLNK